MLKIWSPDDSDPARRPAEPSLAQLTRDVARLRKKSVVLLALSRRLVAAANDMLADLRAERDGAASDPRVDHADGPTTGRSLARPARRNGRRR